MSHVRDVWRLPHDLRDRKPRLPANRHEDARHQREVKCHVAFVAAGAGVAEVLDDIGRPLIGLGQQHAARKLVVHDFADALEERVRLGQVLAIGALALEQVGHRVQPEPVDTEVEPKANDVDHRFLHGRVVVVQVRLVGEEPVPVELAADRIECPVRLFGVDEDDPGVGVLIAGVAPHVVVAVWPVGIVARLLKPRVRLGGVVHHQVGDDADAALVGGVEQRDEIVDGAELGQHLVEVPDVVAAVTQRRVVERRQPDAVDAEPLQVVQAVYESTQITRTVRTGVEERPDQHLVENGVFEPGRVGGQCGGIVEIVGTGVLDHTSFDVTALRRDGARQRLLRRSSIPRCHGYPRRDIGNHARQHAKSVRNQAGGNRIGRQPGHIRADVRPEARPPTSRSRCARRPTWRGRCIAMVSPG